MKNLNSVFQGVILVFDYSRRKTLENIKGWIDLIEAVSIVVYNTAPLLIIDKQGGKYKKSSIEKSLCWTGQQRPN